MILRILLLFFIMCCFYFPDSLGCTIFYIAKDGWILAGNNEDWKDPYTKCWVYPSSSTTNGWIKFGFGNGYPQGGVNEHGLFWDGTACAYLEMPISEKNKQKYPGPVMQKIMEECATLEDAKSVLEQYFCEDQYKAQYLIGDSTGASMIVEGDHIIMKTGDFQVLTNFYPSHPELGGYPCWRYERAVSILESSDTASPFLVGSVLSATHQEGPYPTQYSNIYDLKNKMIYLFHYHNYEEFKVIDINREIHGDTYHYDIPELFSNLRIVAPADHKIVLTSSVNLVWNGLPSSTYDVFYSSDPDFKDCTPVQVHGSKLREKTGMISFYFFLGGTMFAAFLLKRRKVNFFPVLVIFILLGSVKCENDNLSPGGGKIKKFNLVTENLIRGKDYYWKVIAHPFGSASQFTETRIYTFKVAD